MTVTGWDHSLPYVSAPAGSDYLTTEGEAVPAGTRYPEKVSAAFTDRHSFVEHGPSAA